MAYYGYLTPIPSFNMESSVTTDSFMWKQTLRTARLANAKKKNFPPSGSQWTSKWIIDWKTEKWNVALSKYNCHPRLHFPKSQNHSEDKIYDRSPVHNLLFAEEELRRSVRTPQGEESLGDVGTCRIKLHWLQTNWRTSHK